MFRTTCAPATSRSYPRSLHGPLGYPWNQDSCQKWKHETIAAHLTWERRETLRWVTFAQDSHHLSHRISSAISQSLHTCRPIRKHCMYCRNLQESVIIFHISAVPLRGLHCWSILWRPHDKFAAAIIWAMWLSWKLKELEIKGDDEKRWWKSHDLWLGADLCRGTGRRCQFQKKSKDDVHPLGVSA